MNRRTNTDMERRKPKQARRYVGRAFLRPIILGAVGVFLFILVLARVPPVLAETGYTSNPNPTAAPDRWYSVVEQAGSFVLLGIEDDRQALRDVADALLKHSPQVCRDLASEYNSLITVEIFPDQASFDRHVMDPDLRGYYACSGNRRIQMVSPRNPAPRVEIPYTERVLISVHEFVHLVNNAINLEMPIWLNEGVACRIGPHAGYEYVCRHQFPFERIPSFREMVQSYYSVPAADLFAYTLVDFILHEYGQAALNLLIRSPDSLERILGVGPSKFENLWRQYINRHYAHR